MKGRIVLVCLIVSMFAGYMSKVFSYQGDVFSEYAIKSRIVRKAINHGIDPAIALSLVKQESGFNRAAKSQAGAIGLFQLMPQTASWLGINPYYVDQNIEGGITYLKMMKDKFGSTKLALAAYNAGPGAVAKFGRIPPYRETQHYVINIMSNYQHYQQYPDIALVNRPDRQRTQLADIGYTDTIQVNTNNPPRLNFFQRIFSFFS